MLEQAIQSQSDSNLKEKHLQDAAGQLIEVVCKSAVQLQVFICLVALSTTRNV